MDKRILKWIFDVKIAIDEIDLFIESDAKDFLKYKKNLMLKRAVERNLEIIGEALNRILKQDPSITNQITNSKAIISLRNQVIHAYDNISDENIWAIITKHLPLLKEEIYRLINQSI